MSNEKICPKCTEEVGKKFRHNYGWYCSHPKTNRQFVCDKHHKKCGNYDEEIQHCKYRRKQVEQVYKTSKLC